MKNHKIGILLFVLTVIVGLSATVSATAIGDGYSFGGFGLGWILIGLAIVVIVLGIKAVGIIKAPLAKKLFAPMIMLLLVGLALQYIEVPDALPVDTTGAGTLACPDFEITATATITGTNYITTTVWDEDDNTLTVPLTVSDSSDGNLTGHITGLNITFDPIGSGFTADDITTVYFSTDYLMKYGGEYVLDEDTSGYEAEWTTASGTVDYADSLDITADSTGWANINYIMNNGTAANWVDELSAIGDSVTWHINMWNACNTWTDTITVTAIVVSYTA